MILGLLGKAGSGKDTVAQMIAPRHLVQIDGQVVDVRERWTSEWGDDLGPVADVHLAYLRLCGGALRQDAAQIGFADKLKAISRDVYDFSYLQLWGPSDYRNAPDERYPRAHSGHEWGPADDDHPDGAACVRCGQINPLAVPTPCTTYLTPREALQLLGTEWGRACWPDTWAARAVRFAHELTSTARILPKGQGSYIIGRVGLTVISDMRFANEAAVVRAAGGLVWRIVRPDAPGLGEHGAHASETASDDPVLSALVTRTIMNDDGLETLLARVEASLKEDGL
jgi:hypothetical protein